MITRGLTQNDIKEIDSNIKKQPFRQVQNNIENNKLQRGMT